MSRSSRVFIVYYLPVILWALAIFMVSAQPSLPSPEIATLDFLIKKTGHITVYGILYFLLFRAWLQTNNRYFSNKRALVWGPILLCLLYAISDEIHQSFIPGRFPSARDVGFDMLGVSIVFLRIHGYF